MDGQQGHIAVNRICFKSTPQSVPFERSEMIDLYCERIGERFWAEPLNALTNLVFCHVFHNFYILSAAASAQFHNNPDSPGSVVIRLDIEPDS